MEWCLAADEVAHFIIVSQVIEMKVMKETCLGRRGMLRLTQVMSMVVTVTIREIQALAIQKTQVLRR